MARVESENAVALKSGVWYMLSNFLTRGIVFISTPIFARTLSTAEFGGFHVYATWQTLLSIVCGLQFPLTLNRAKFDFQDSERGEYIATNLIASNLLTIFLFVIFLSSGWIQNELLQLDTKYLAFMFLYMICYPAFEVFQCEQRIAYRYKVSASLSFSSVLLGITLSVVFALTFPDRLFGRIFGQYLPPIALGCAFLVYYLREGFAFKPKYCKYALRISIPLVFSYLSSQILTSSDKIVLRHISTEENVAFIGLVTTCGHIMSMFIQSVNNAWMPWMYDKYHAGRLKEINGAFSRLQGLVALGALFVVAIGPELILILGGNKYAGALILVPPVISGSIFSFMIFQYLNIETYYKKTFFAGISTTLTAALNIWLDVVFVNLYGFWAVSYVTAACYAVLMTAHYLYVRFVLKDALSNAANWAASLAAGSVLTCAGNLLYRGNGLRFVAAGACVIAALALAAATVPHTRFARALKRD